MAVNEKVAIQGGLNVEEEEDESSMQCDIRE